MEQNHKCALTTNLVLDRLKQRVSAYNARLLLKTALIESGVSGDEADTQMDYETAKNLCMRLISKGGPSFHVGQALYKEYLQ